jgi:hypothetical protein
LTPQALGEPRSVRHLWAGIIGHHIKPHDFGVDYATKRRFQGGPAARGGERQSVRAAPSDCIGPCALGVADDRQRTELDCGDVVALCRIGEPGDGGVPAGCGDRHPKMIEYPPQLRVISLPELSVADETLAISEQVKRAVGNPSPGLAVVQ